MAQNPKKFEVPVTVNGDLNSTAAVTAAGNLRSTNSSGDEGGEIFLNKAVTNTTLTGGVTIDVFQDKLRFFEQGGTARGFYIDISGGGAGVGTNLVSGGSYTLPTASSTVLGGIKIGPGLSIDGSGVVTASGSSSSNSFSTIATPFGTSPVAATSADTLTYTSSGGLTITGTASTDTIAFAVNSSSANAASTIVIRDAAGSFSSNVIAATTITATGVTASTFTATISSGTAPLVITSPTVVANLASAYAVRGAIIGAAAPTTASTSNMGRIYVSTTTPTDTAVTGDVWISY